MSPQEETRYQDGAAPMRVARHFERGGDVTGPTESGPRELAKMNVHVARLALTGHALVAHGRASSHRKETRFAFVALDEHHGLMSSGQSKCGFFVRETGSRELRDLHAVAGLACGSFLPQVHVGMATRTTGRRAFERRQRHRRFTRSHGSCRRAKYVALAAGKRRVLALEKLGSSLMNVVRDTEAG